MPNEQFDDEPFKAVSLFNDGRRFRKHRSLGWLLKIAIAAEIYNGMFIFFFLQPWSKGLEHYSHHLRKQFTLAFTYFRFYWSNEYIHSRHTTCRRTMLSILSYWGWGGGGGGGRGVDNESNYAYRHYCIDTVILWQAIDMTVLVLRFSIY